ncbi:MAG: flagellar M-ring protein FliF, partial [Butyrivibrio sp.]|nr:flagellar M-ring protein FliF [Butyrivibrio sp.]
MQERLRELLQRVLDWWNKFSTRQKTIIISVAAAVVLTIVILVSILTRPQYILLMNAESTAQASEVIELLEAESIKYKVSDDGLEIQVLKNQESQANLLLGSNGIPAADYSIDNVTSGSFSTTESDKKKKYVVYLEKQLENDFLVYFDAIETAHVELNIPDDDGTLIAGTEPSSASVLLQISDPENFNEDNAAFLAKAIATALGNENTENITIMDTTGNMLFSGSEEVSSIGLASSQLSLKQKAEQLIKSEVKKVLLGTNLYDSVEVASNLDLDFSEVEETEHTYTPPEGMSQGVFSHSDVYSSESTNGVDGVPGTDTNEDDLTTYVTEDYQDSTTSVSEESYDYLPNEKITVTKSQPGAVNYENSSISVSAVNYTVIMEDEYKADDHDGLTYAEFKAQNSNPILQVLDEDSNTKLTGLVANATGIENANITIATYDEYVFFDSTGSNITITDVLQILLIIIILALLAFVIFRSMYVKKEQEEEEPEELSVEQLLESQPEEEILENIEMDEGSETKKLIEKFIDENPEAAANLLRNWLNDDYA